MAPRNPKPVETQTDTPETPEVDSVQVEVTTIDPSIPLHALSVPASTNPVVLPGAAWPNTLSVDQFAIIVDRLHDVRQFVDQNLTFGEAVGQLRKRFVRGHQRDFNIVDGIVAQGRDASGGESLTQRQAELLMDTISYLTGTKTHHYAPTAALYAQMTPGVREILVNEGLRVQTRADLTTFRAKVRALTRTDLVGEIAGAEPDEDAEAW